MRLSKHCFMLELQTPNPPSPQIFISYASEDSRRVSAIARKLKKMGFSIWRDQEQLLPGQNFPQIIHEAFSGARVVLLCLSARFVNKQGFCQKELSWTEERLTQAAAKQIAVIPILLDNVPVIPDFLTNIHYLKKQDRQFYQTLKRALVKAGCVYAVMQDIAPVSMPRPQLHAELDRVLIQTWRKRKE